MASVKPLVKPAQIVMALVLKEHGLRLSQRLSASRLSVALCRHYMAQMQSVGLSILLPVKHQKNGTVNYA